MMTRTPFQVLLFIWLSLVLGCAGIYHTEIFPEDALAQLNKAVTFPQVRESPSSHQGTLMMVGGEVISAKRLKDYTRLTVLQLPLDRSQKPSTDRTQSQGRFLAMQPEFLDPATLPPGTRVTLIGTVSGATTEMLDEMEYTYPVLTIKHLKVWPEQVPLPYWYSPHAYGPYWYRPYYIGPYGGRYWDTLHPYGW